MPDDDYTQITNDLFRVRLDRLPDVELKTVPSSAFLARLVLVLQVRPDLERALATPDRGAILEVDMVWDVAAKIYGQIWQLAQTMDLPLPELSERRV
ncbi:MAG: hypothetical protein WDN29_01275 [Methylovirgula sp.]